MLLVGALLAAIVIGVWFFLLRGDGGATSDFLGARDQLAAATKHVESAATQVERFRELHAFQTTVDAQRHVMQEQLAVFERLANETSGQSAHWASDAANNARSVLSALDAYAAAIFDHRLADATEALAQMQAYVAYVDRAATEWNKIH